MITLTARSARTSFEGPEAQLKKMFRALRIKDERKAFWRAKSILERVNYFAGSANRREKIAKLKEDARWVRFYDRRSDTFQTGLLPRVLKRLKKKGVEYELIDERKHPPQFDLDIKEFRFVDKVEKRDEQLDMLKAALKHSRGILFGATNVGKTEVACAIISEYERQTGKVPRVLFLIHRAGLVEQTTERFRKHLDCPVTMVGAGEKTIPMARGVIVATIQTAANLIDNWDFTRFQERCDVLFIDEFHLNKAKTCLEIVEENFAPMRFGLSGTIDESNKAKMMHYIGMTGPIISEVRNKQLVEMGRSAKPFAVFKEVPAEYIPKQLGFVRAYREGVVKNQIRNRMVVKDTIRHLTKDRKVLVTVARIAHGHILKEKLQKKMDRRVEFLSGSSPLEIRRRVIRDFEKGKVGVLIGSQIFDVGMDIPAITAWVNAGGGKGWELVLQRLGRTLRRKTTGRNVVHLSDYIDKHNKYLFNHSLARISHYLKEEIVDIKIIEEEKNSGNK